MGLAARFGTPHSNNPVAAAPVAAHNPALQVDLEIDKEAANLTGHRSAVLQTQMEAPVVADFHTGVGPLDQRVQIVPCMALAAWLHRVEAQVGERTVVDRENVRAGVEVEAEADPAAAAAAADRRTAGEEGLLVAKADNATPDGQQEVVVEEVLLTGVVPCKEVEGGEDGEGDTTMVALAVEVEVDAATEALEIFDFGSEPMNCSPHQGEASSSWTALP